MTSRLIWRRANGFALEAAPDKFGRVPGKRNGAGYPQADDKLKCRESEQPKRGGGTEIKITVRKSLNDIVYNGDFRTKALRNRRGTEHKLQQFGKFRIAENHVEEVIEMIFVLHQHASGMGVGIDAGHSGHLAQSVCDGIEIALVVPFAVDPEARPPGHVMDQTGFRTLR